MNYIKKNSLEEKELLERFLRYVKTYSESDSNKADEGIMPSTPQQRDFANMIAEEMKAAGLENVHVTEFCYAYGVLPASDGFENVPPFCLLSHMDTVDEVSGKNVNPVVHNLRKRIRSTRLRTKRSPRPHASAIRLSRRTGTRSSVRTIRRASRRS